MGVADGIYAVTVLITERTITGEPVPPEGVLEVRKYAACSEDHARESAARGLTDTEEIVSVEPAALTQQDKEQG
jgi:hypothetical protein